MDMSTSLLVSIVIWGLAIFRISELLVIDNGPFDIFFHLRSFANRYRNNFLGATIVGALGCVHCTAIYVAAGLVLAYYTLPTKLVFIVIYVFALCGMASIYLKLFGRSQ